jgi:peptidase A4-like protein
MVSKTKKLVLVLISLCLPALLASPVLASPMQLSERPFFLGHHMVSKLSGAAQETSENWSGYAATGSNGAYSSVASSWTQPSVVCSAGQNTYSAYWVGLDGYSDQTVEQIGTEANCVSGKAVYSAWYEMYPQNPYELGLSLPVAVGSTITASVQYNPGTTIKTRFNTRTTKASFTLTLSNTTTGRSFTTTVTARNQANRSSAEVIAEALYSNGILPLSNFGTVNFTSSLVNGTALGAATGLQDIIMQDPHGMIATPSAFDTTNQNFSVTWSD